MSVPDHKSAVKVILTRLRYELGDTRRIRVNNNRSVTYLDIVRRINTRGRHKWNSCVQQWSNHVRTRGLNFRPKIIVET